MFPLSAGDRNETLAVLWILAECVCHSRNSRCAKRALQPAARSIHSRQYSLVAPFRWAGSGSSLPTSLDNIFPYGRYTMIQGAFLTLSFTLS